MAIKKASTTYFDLLDEVRGGTLRGIYVLHGEEPYFIDKLQDAIVESALTPDECDFNLTVMYGVDISDMRDVVSRCRQFPVMSPRQVVVVREAQNAGKNNNRGNANELNLLAHYALKPLPTTVLVVCFKGGAIKAKEFTDAVRKLGSGGIVWESARLREGRPLENFTNGYVKAAGCTIDEKSLSMLTANIGNDISRLTGEIDKLKLLVGSDKRITPELIDRNIGISKDYNYFELEDALLRRDAAKVYRIVDYYERNHKDNPVVVTVSMLFGFFSNVLLYHTSRDRSQAGLMAATGTKSAFRLGKFRDAAQTYSSMGCVAIISYLRQCDAKSKGLGSRQDSYALLKDLMYNILHTK